jgi:Bardet-Biedl syndrome 9 protein
VIAYQDPLPLADFFMTIDEHFACRLELQKLNLALNDRAHQYRVVQKRLLLRFKVVSVAA